MSTAHNLFYLFFDGIWNDNFHVPYAAYVVSKLPVQYVQYTYLVILATYILLLTVSLRVLAWLSYKLCVVVMVVWYVASWSSGGGFGVLLLGMILVEFIWGWKASNGTYSSIPAIVSYGRWDTPRREMSYSLLWFVGILLVIGGVMLADRERTDTLIIVGACTFFLVFTTQVQTLGGNSIWSHLPTIAMLALLLLLWEPFRTSITDSLRRETIRSVPDTREEVEARVLGDWNLNPLHLIYLWTGRFSTSAPYAGLGGAVGYIKVCIGAAFGAFLTVDAWFGPASMIEGQVAREKKEGPLPVFSAGNYKASFPYLFIAVSAVELAAGVWTKNSAIVLGGVLGALLWYPLMHGVWWTRGVAASCQKLRTNIILYMGDGPAGKRFAVCWFSILACVFLDFWNGFGQIFFVQILLLIMSLQHKKTMLFSLGVFTGSIPLTLAPLLDKDMIDGDLKDGYGVNRVAADGNVGGATEQGLFGGHSKGVSSETPREVTEEVKKKSKMKKRIPYNPMILSALGPGDWDLSAFSESEVAAWRKHVGRHL